MARDLSVQQPLDAQNQGVGGIAGHGVEEARHQLQEIKHNKHTRAGV